MIERNLNLWAGLLILIGGLFGLFYLIPTHIGAGFGFGLSPRFFPYLCMGIITLLGALLFISRLRDPNMEDRPIALDRRILRRLFMFVSIMAIGLLIMSEIGYVVGSMVLIAGFMLAMGERRVSWIVPTAVLWPCLMWLLFGLLLNAPLG